MGITQKQKHEARLNFLPKVINGALAGMAGASATYPLDLAKTRLQSQTVGPRGQVLYKSMWDCIKKVMKYEGIKGLYSGCYIELLFITPEKIIKLVSNDFFRYHFRNSETECSLPRQMVAAGFAGILQISVSTPRGLLKIQLQDAGRRKSEAIASEAVVWWSFLTGVVTAATAALAVTPADVVKTRLQMDAAKYRPVYKNSMHCIKKTLAKEGWPAFFRGGSCRVAEIAPLFGIMQSVYYLGIGEFLFGVKQVKNV